MVTGFVNGQRLRLGAPVVAADTIDYLTAQFVFQTADWLGLEIWSHWQNGAEVYDIPLEDGRITEAAHLNLGAGTWNVWLHGNRYADGAVVQRITTEKARVEVVPTGSLDGEPFPEIPASVAEQIFARLENVEENGPGGLSPVDKTDAMTAEVGRDENGRLWTAGTGKGVKTLSIRRTEQGIELGVVLEDGSKIEALVPATDVRFEKTAPTTETPGAEGELLFDESAGVLYVGGGAYVPAFGDKTEYLWTAVGGGSGLPEHTAADEGKVLRIVDGAAAWTDGISDVERLIAAVSAGGEITLAPDADITVSETLTLPAGTVIHGNGATVRRAAGFEEVLFSLDAGCRLENFVIEGNRSAMVNPKWDKTMEISTHANCVIDSITINNANEAIVVYEDDVIVRGCRLNNCGGNGIHMSGANRTRIEDCVIIGANKSASQMGNSNGCIYWCMESNETVVTGCHCEDGLAGFGGIDGIDNMHLKITGCTVKNCDHAAFGAYKSTGGPIDVVISGNQFIECGNLELSDASQKVAPGDGLVISGNLFTDTKIRLQGFRNANVTGNTLRGGNIALIRCPYCAVADNVIDNPGGSGVYSEHSPNLSVSGNSIRCKSYGIYGEGCAGIVIFGNIVRQSPHNVNTDCIKLNSCPEAAVDNNKLFVYFGGGLMGGENCRTMGNYIVVADSSQIAIRVWGGAKNYVVAQNMSNGTFAVAAGTNAVVQNNIVIESTAFVDVTYTLTNLTTDGFAKALTEDDFGFTLTAADGYALPDTITVTMGGTALAAGTGYTYDKATGKVTVYRVSGAVEVTAGGAA